MQVQLINDAYNLVIDAIVGPEIDLKDVREPYSGILVTLKQVKIPIASVDVPSGIFSITHSIIHNPFQNMTSFINQDVNEFIWKWFTGTKKFVKIQLVWKDVCI